MKTVTVVVIPTRINFQIKCRAHAKRVIYGKTSATDNIGGIGTHQDIICNKTCDNNDYLSGSGSLSVPERKVVDFNKNSGENK